MSRDDEQDGLGTVRIDLEPTEMEVTCRLKPDRRRHLATLDDWSRALKNFRPTEPAPGPPKVAPLSLGFHKRCGNACS